MFKRSFRFYEYLHIPFWLVKDTCWALEFKVLGVCMIIPTLTLALVLAWKTRKEPAGLLPNIAIALWISANSIWMCDEFFGLKIKEICYIPFALGLVVIGWWLLVYFPKLNKQLREND